MNDGNALNRKNTKSAIITDHLLCISRVSNITCCRDRQSSSATTYFVGDTDNIVGVGAIWVNSGPWPCASYASFRIEIAGQFVGLHDSNVVIESGQVV